MDRTIVKTLLSDDEMHRVDIFRRDDGLFGYVQLRRYLRQHGEFWTSLGPFGTITDSAETAEREARATVPWLAQTGGTSNYLGMTVNERLFVAGLLDEWDQALRRRDRPKLIQILFSVDLGEDAEPIADKALKNPISTIRAVLNRDWDPIGGCPEDEYDGYAGELSSMLRDGASDDQLLAYLEWAEIKHMGLSGPFDRARGLRVIESLRALELPTR